jgi:hypothetical protein
MSVIDIITSIKLTFNQIFSWMHTKFMKKSFNILNFAWLSPLLFAVFPILTLWQINFTAMDAIDVLSPLLEALIAGVILYFLFKLIFKGATKAGLLTTLILILYFSYGQIFAALRQLPGLGALVAHHRILGSIWVLLFLAGGFLILKFGSRLTGVTLFLNSTGLVLLILVGGQLGYAQYQQSNTISTNVNGKSKNSAGLNKWSVTDRSNLPDIYVILEDSYARNDVLLKNFNYDNQPFIQAITKLGFVVPRCSMSNYAFTDFSMSSLFNMNYVETFYPHIDKTAIKNNYAPFKEYIWHSQVRQNLTALGYKTISVQSDYDWGEIPDADIFYTAKIPKNAMVEIFNHSDFLDELNQTSLMKILIDAEAVSPGLSDEMSKLDLSLRLPSTKVDKRYYVLTSALTRLENMPQIPGPKFTYVHIMALHLPYILGPNGEYQKTDSESGYLDALLYLNRQMLQILPKIIQNSKVPPIIILMGDHGIGSSGMDSRLDNFEAIYFPGAGKQLVYPSITPINIFRIIFNTYLNGSYPLLKDTSYNFVVPHRQDFYPIPPNCPK